MQTARTRRSSIRSKKLKKRLRKPLVNRSNGSGLKVKRSCRIGKQLSLGGYRDDEEKWPEIQDTMIDGMIRLERHSDLILTGYRRNFIITDLYNAVVTCRPAGA